MRLFASACILLATCAAVASAQTNEIKFTGAAWKLSEVVVGETQTLTVTLTDATSDTYVLANITTPDGYDEIDGVTTGASVVFEYPVSTDAAPGTYKLTRVTGEDDQARAIPAFTKGVAFTVLPTRVQSHVLARSVDQTTHEAVQPSRFFRDDEPQAVALANIAPTHAGQEYSFVFISPNGTSTDQTGTVLEDSTSPLPVTGAMRIAGQPAASSIGTWHVDFSVDGIRLYREDFTVNRTLHFADAAFRNATAFSLGTNRYAVALNVRDAAAGTTLFTYAFSDGFVTSGHGLQYVSHLFADDGHARDVAVTARDALNHTRQAQFHLQDADKPFVPPSPVPASADPGPPSTGGFPWMQTLIALGLGIVVGRWSRGRF